ncbi:unnamed protein product [Rotaria sp. Silwood1]|nr:unnamed protein product [Rotaria sp. Silwood1]
MVPDPYGHIPARVRRNVDFPDPLRPVAKTRRLNQIRFRYEYTSIGRKATVSPIGKVMVPDPYGHIPARVRRNVDFPDPLRPVAKTRRLNQIRFRYEYTSIGIVQIRDKI